jgi:hypothetical protein
VSVLVIGTVRARGADRIEPLELTGEFAIPGAADSDPTTLTGNRKVQAHHV